MTRREPLGGPGPLITRRGAENLRGPHAAGPLGTPGKQPGLPPGARRGSFGPTVLAKELQAWLARGTRAHGGYWRHLRSEVPPTWPTVFAPRQHCVVRVARRESAAKRWRRRDWIAETTVNGPGNHCGGARRGRNPRSDAFGGRRVMCLGHNQPHGVWRCRIWARRSSFGLNACIGLARNPKRAARVGTASVGATCGLKCSRPAPRCVRLGSNAWCSWRGANPP